MRQYNWDDNKNLKLIVSRKISFEEIVLAIEHGALIDEIEHPNQQKYRGQKMFIVQVGDYVYLVPYVENENVLFLKTVIPSRKATKRYLAGGQ